MYERSTSAHITLVLGGARSGKSELAESLASMSPQPVTYVATGWASDPEMAERIERHRARRPSGWATLEVAGSAPTPAAATPAPAGPATTPAGPATPTPAGPATPATAGHSTPATAAHSTPAPATPAPATPAPAGSATASAGPGTPIPPSAELAELLVGTAGTVLVDSLGTWVAGAPGFGVDADALCAALLGRTGASIVVSEEVGLGVHPETELGRDFRDALGELNQAVAAVADEVLLVVAGRALRLEDPGTPVAPLAGEPAEGGRASRPGVARGRGGA